VPVILGVIICLALGPPRPRSTAAAPASRRVSPARVLHDFGSDGDAQLLQQWAQPGRLFDRVTFSLPFGCAEPSQRVSKSHNAHSSVGNEHVLPFDLPLSPHGGNPSRVPIEAICGLSAPKKILVLNAHVSGAWFRDIQGTKDILPLFSLFSHH
jgi:hypothetical protein